MAVFVTVGTTSFDELIEEVNKPRFHKALYNLGYRRIFIQYGTGTTEPLVQGSLLDIVAFRFSSDLESIFSDSALVISHGGAGTCIEALSPPGKRKLIIVVNEKLMNNHQEELAATMYEERHAFVSRVNDLFDFISTGHVNYFPKCKKPNFECDGDPRSLLGPSTTPRSVGLVPFERGNASSLIDFINDLLGLPTTK